MQYQEILALLSYAGDHGHAVRVTTDGAAEVVGRTHQRRRPHHGARGLSPPCRGRGHRDLHLPQRDTGRAAVVASPWSPARSPVCSGLKHLKHGPRTNGWGRAEFRSRAPPTRRLHDSRKADRWKAFLPSSSYSAAARCSCLPPARSARPSPSGSAIPDLRPALDPELLAEVDALRHDVAELAERLDFAERLLASKRENHEQLPGGQG